MRILLLADNLVGWKVVSHLKSLGEDIIGLFIHPPEYQHYAQEIINSSGLDQSKIFVSTKKWSNEDLSKVKMLSPDIILVIFWNYILPKDFIDIPQKGCINFHLSYLPYNRGKKPNVWPIIDGTPAGVTMHYIDEGIDSGKIIAQNKVDIDPIDTAGSLYKKLLNEIVELFKDIWPDLKDDKIQPKEQQLEKGTFHLDKEFKNLDIIDLEKDYKASELINILRARTFHPNPSSYFIQDGKKVYARISLEYGK